MAKATNVVKNKVAPKKAAVKNKSAKKKVVVKTIKAAKPAAKTIVRPPPKESVKKIEKKIELHPKVQTAEGWKREMIRLKTK